MREIGTPHITEGIPFPSDIVGVVIGSSALAVVAMDYPSAVATGSSRAHIMRITSQVPFYFKDGSTHANIPTTGATSAGSTANSRLVGTSSQSKIEEWYQIPAGSTGYSMAFPSSGIATVEFFRRS
jgi:hypothetical protein